MPVNAFVQMKDDLKKDIFVNKSFNKIHRKIYMILKVFFLNFDFETEQYFE